MGEKKVKTPKVKKIMGVPTDFDFGKNIKDISIDIDKHKLANLIFLLALNLALDGVLIFFLTVMTNIWTLMISMLTMAGCLIWSVMTYSKSVEKVRYTIFDNAIVQNFQNSIYIGEYSQIYKVKIKYSLFDILGKNKTWTMMVKSKNKYNELLVFYYINGNPEELIDFLVSKNKNIKVIWNRKVVTKADDLSDSNIEKMSVEQIEPTIELQTKKTSKKSSKKK